MKHQKQAQHGFVLILVLWIIAFMLIGASFFAARIDRAIKLAQNAKYDQQVQRDIFSTRSEILFRMATTPFTREGLGVGLEAIRLDGRAYQGEAETIIRIQDNRGLINLNTADAGQLTRLLAHYGVNTRDTPYLIDALHDYIDADSLRRFNGAEAKDYELAGLPPPRNARLITPAELHGVYGWARQKNLWGKDNIEHLFTTSNSAAINPNTAPETVLAILPGMNFELAKALASRRDQHPLVSETDLSAITGLPVQQYLFTLIFVPANSARITQYQPGQSVAISYNVEITPTDMEKPWRIDYFHKVPLSFKYEPPEKTWPLPPRFVGPAPSPGSIFGIK